MQFIQIFLFANVSLEQFVLTESSHNERKFFDKRNCLIFVINKLHKLHKVKISDFNNYGLLSN